MEALLARLGLKGSYQVHLAPVLLQPDQRAHQVYLGFESPESVKKSLENLYPSVTLVHVVAPGGRSAVRLSEDWPWPAEASAVVPAVRTDHPGGFYGLVWIMDRLLGPGGCPWDQEQTHKSLMRHLIEESYELLDAVEAEDRDSMIEELGDVLLQPVFHGQMAAMGEGWTTESVVRALSDKLIRRHPHVFGDATAENSDEVLVNWNRIKAEEKEKKLDKSVLAGVPRHLPALQRAFEVSRRAARCGFEWPDIEAVWDKVREEEKELNEAWALGDREAAADEMGDLLFTLVNVARWMKIEPEDALRRMVDRFSTRFRTMEAASETPLSELSPEEWDRLWTEAKRIHSAS